MRGMLSNSKLSSLIPNELIVNIGLSLDYINLKINQFENLKMKTRRNAHYTFSNYPIFKFSNKVIFKFIFFLRKNR